MDLSSIQKTLLEKREELFSRLEAIQKDSRETRDADFEEQALEAENDEVLTELGREALEEISQIDTALRRLEEGSYGACMICGAAINNARLHALPFTTTCIDCAATH